MEHNKALRKGRLDNYLSWMGLVVLASGVVAVIIGGIWCGGRASSKMIGKE